MLNSKFKYIVTISLLIFVKISFGAASEPHLFPPQDKPTAAETAQISAEIKNKTYSSYYYYGPAENKKYPVDYAKARKFAFVELSIPDPGYSFSPDTPVVYGAETLVMIYANGMGVPRNIDLARKILKKYILSKSQDPNYKSDVVSKLNDMQFDPFAEPIDMGLYTDRFPAPGDAVPVEVHFSKENNLRLIETARLSENWNSEEKAALDKLLRAADNFFQKQSSEFAQDTCGKGKSYPDYIAMSGVAQQRAQLTKDLKILAAGKDPAYRGRPQYSSHTKEDFIQSDKKLNRIYGELIAVLKREKIKDSTYRKKGTCERPACGLQELPDVSDISANERAWLVYRDAWTALLKLRAPSQPLDPFKTVLTDRRIKQLKEYKGDLDGYAEAACGDDLG